MIAVEIPVVQSRDSSSGIKMAARIRSPTIQEKNWLGDGVVSCRTYQSAPANRAHRNATMANQYSSFAIGFHTPSFPVSFTRSMISRMIHATSQAARPVTMAVARTPPMNIVGLTCGRLVAGRRRGGVAGGGAAA